MNMFTISVRFFCKYLLCLILFLLMPAAAFALPPVQVTYPNETRVNIIQEAEKYLGVPYVYGGMSKSGVDCSGLVYLVFQNTINVPLPRTVKDLYSWTERINSHELQQGDLVFFNTTGSVSHVGIYAGSGMFINAASEGPRTGVIYSSLDESYWKRTYIGAGRVLSEGSESAPPILASAPERQADKGKPQVPNQQNNSSLRFSLGGAVSWNNYIHESRAVRGAGFLLGVQYALPLAEKNMKIGLELRPEWDAALSVFRLPLTLSFGGDMFRAFLGPVLSIGNPVLDVPEGKRSFDGGTSWAGEAGITFAPFTFNANGGKFAVYGELAWQFYYPESGQSDNSMADLSAAMRLSTGIRFVFGK